MLRSLYSFSKAKQAAKPQNRVAIAYARRSAEVLPRALCCYIHALHSAVLHGKCDVIDHSAQEPTKLSDVLMKLCLTDALVTAIGTHTTTAVPTAAFFTQLH